MPEEIQSAQDLKKLYKLMQLYEEKLIQFAYSYIGDSESAQDYVLESFMDYWSNRYLLDNTANIPAYILTIVKHKCLNHLRHKKNHEVVADHIRELHEWELNLQINSLSSCDPKELFTSEIYEIVEKTLNKLPLDTKKIFYLSRFENKSRKEIAELMNMSTKGVEYHIGKALAALRHNLKDYMFLLFLTLFN